MYLHRYLKSKGQSVRHLQRYASTQRYQHRSLQKHRSLSKSSSISPALSKQICLQLALALHLDKAPLIPTKIIIAANQSMSCFGDLHATWHTRGLHPARSVHRVTKQTVTRHPGAHHARANVTRVHPSPDLALHTVWHGQGPRCCQGRFAKENGCSGRT